MFSPDDPHPTGKVIIFVRQGLSFSKLSTSSFCLLDPYSDYVGVNISLSNSSSLSFLNVYALPICSSLTDSRTNFFSPFIFLPPEISLFWKISAAITSSGIQRVLLNPLGRKYSIVTSFHSMILTTYSSPHSADTRSSPVSSLLSPFSPSLAHGRYLKNFVLITYQFY